MTAASNTSRPFMVTEVAEGVHVLGSLRVNWYVVADGGAYTIVDAGLPVHWPQVGALLTALGAGLDDVEAVLVTHAHGDHAGNAERLRTEAAASVYAHAQDWEVMRTGQDPMPGLAQGLTMLLDVVRRPVLRSFMVEVIRGGGLPTFPAVPELSALGDGEVLDVPGRPRVVHVPGHTHGSCALHLADAGVVFTGDALITYGLAAPARRRYGPQLVKDSWQEDPVQALASLDRLEGLGAHTVLPGHGGPWTGGIDAAVEHARRLGRY